MNAAPQNHINFDEWNEIMYRYLQDAEDETIGIQDENHKDIHFIFSQILGSCIQSNKRGNKWLIPPKKDFLLSGERVVVISKQGIEVAFGLFQSCFYMSIELELEELSCLLSVGDDFWIKLAELSNYGRLEFLFDRPLEEPTQSRIQQITGKSKSIITKVLSNLIGHELDNCKDSDFMLSIENQWPLGIEWCDLLEKSIKTFDNLYQLKYKLYRILYIRKKSRRK